MEIDYRELLDLKDQIIPYLLPCDKNEKIINDTKKAIKQFHDITFEKHQNMKVKKLYINNMDDEQIWQQLSNNFEQILQKSDQQLAKIQRNFPLIEEKKQRKNNEENVIINEDDDIDENNDDDIDENDDDDIDENDDENDDDYDDEYGNEQQDDNEQINDKNLDEEFFGKPEDYQSEEDVFEQKKKSKQSKKEQKLQDEMKYFESKVALNRFLDEADNIDIEKQNLDNNKNNEYDGLYGSDEDEEDEDDDEDGEQQGFADDGDDNDLDFDGQDDYEDEDEMQMAPKRKKVKKSEQEPIDDSEIEDGVFEEQREQELEMEENLQETSNKPQSKLENQMDFLENKLIGKKDWQMAGEVGSQQRPVNSLLQEHFDFKSGLKVETEINKEYTENLEKLIKQRILDEAWDDVQEWKPPSSLQENFNNLNELNFTKDTQGLSGLYEQNYKQSILNLPQNEEDDVLKKEVELLFRKVCFSLDQLSNLNFTPKPFMDEVKIVKNISTIKLEEKIPIYMSDRNQKSAKEILGKTKVHFEEKDELDTEERKSKHKQVKRNIRSRNKEKQKKATLQQLKSTGQTKFNLNQIQKGNNKAKKQIKDKKEQSVSFTKSQNFFKNLQQNMDQKAAPQKEIKQKAINYKL